MSLRSGKQYQLKSNQTNYSAQQENETEEHRSERVMSARSADSKSIHSKSSKRSRQSSIGSAAIRARAKAEAARAQLSFAEQEADVIKKKADLEASLHLLKSQKAVAVALAEAAAYEEAIESGEF